ncbi:Ferrochelatase, protoheme ferro-lyase [hydrothermal vent metagenome]|uniref:Ferrochelatase, protoheme ferro-lyase n=1 Tax=hydrothermal vent metagenome TaxID=652676 RepID=A0A3B1CBN0_9ZZZZ
MRKKRSTLFVVGATLFFIFSTASVLLAEKPRMQKTGFLVLAPDRGFLGNQEIKTLFDEFKKDYSAALALVGSNYNGVESEYSVYITDAIKTLKDEGARDIVVLPLFLSAENPVLKKLMPHLPAYATGARLRWAAPLSESHLTAQVLLDRVSEKSKNPEQEHVVILGMGVMDEAGEAALRTDLEKLAAYVHRYRSFKSIEIGIYYHRRADAALKEKKNKAVDDLVIRSAAKKGQVIAVPFFIGPKFDNRMSMTHWLSNKFKAYDLDFVGREIMPHPNLLRWLKKTANVYLTPASAQVGVVIMPHGATQPYNDVIERVIEPLQNRYRIEMAYGMGDPELIQQAVSRLESEGVRRIVFVRMYSLSGQMKPLTDYILGLTNDPPHAHHTGDAPPAQIRSAVLFSSFGGYEEDPEIAQILHERIGAISRKPADETVILVAHGAGDDEANTRWLARMEGHAARLRRMSEPAFRAIKTATVREDWPEKREAAVMQLKEMIEAGKRDGRVLLISNRLYGSGPYERFLEEVGLKKGTHYEMNAQGFAPHPVITRWLENGIEGALRDFEREALKTAATRVLK